MTVIEGRENIMGFVFMMTLRALEFEAETGMKTSRFSALAAAQRNYGIKAKTRKGAIKEMRAILEEAEAERYMEVDR